MQLNLKMMMMMNCVATAVLLSVMIVGSDGAEKSWECCTSVSTTEITSPITGFRLQKRNPPCVKAVIFYTAEGAKCSHWREAWVWEKIQELKKRQHQKLDMTMNSTVSSPLSTTSS